MNKILIIIVAIVAVIGFSVLMFYNNLVSANEAVNNQWAQVETQYQRRFDLIPNLVNSVKGVMQQEQKIFGDLAEARTRYANAASVDEKIGAANQVESALSRLLVIVENYPQLKSSENVQTLMAQLEGTENRISVERKKFNDKVKSYNLATKKFPEKLFAMLFDFKERPYFESAAGAENVPNIIFRDF